jgi:glutamate/tyrosine decarboxylase-like PLP-dependent enzyme
MVGRNIELSRRMYREIAAAPELEAATQNLSVATFRYVPADLNPADPADSDYLDDLNEALLGRLQTGGEVYLSNAVIAGRFLLRACIVNFRSRESDVRALPEIVRRNGAELDREMRARR